MPYFLKIENVWGKQVIKYGLKGFYSNFIPKEKYFYERISLYSIIGDEIAVASEFSDTVYIYNHLKDKIVNKLN